MMTGVQCSDASHACVAVAEELHIPEEEVKNARRAILKAGREQLVLCNMVGGAAPEALLRRRVDVPDIETVLTDAERAALDEHQSLTRAMLVDALLAQGVSAEDVERRFAALEEEARKASAREAAVRTAPATRDEPAANEESKLVGPVVIAVTIACLAAAVCYHACR